LGRLDLVVEVIRQNFAISWMMLTLVEGIVRAEGGIGVLLLNNNKLLRLADVFAIQFVILLMGIFLDYAIGLARQLLFPYSKLTLEKWVGSGQFPVSSHERKNPHKFAQSASSAFPSRHEGKAIYIIN